MDNLIINNQVENPQPLTINPVVGTPTNSAKSIQMVGGLFTVTDDALLYGVGTSRSLYPEPVSSGPVACSFTSASTTVTINNSAYDTALAAFDGSVGNLHGLGISDPNPTATSGVASTLSTQPSGIGTFKVVDAANSTQAAENLMLGGAKQFFAVIDQFGTVLGTLSCGYGVELTTKFTTPIPLKPGIQYALITFGGANAIPLSTSRSVTGNSLMVLGSGIPLTTVTGFGATTNKQITVSGYQGAFTTALYKGEGTPGDYMSTTATMPYLARILSIDSLGNGVMFPAFSSTTVGTFPKYLATFNNPTKILSNIMTSKGGWSYISGLASGANWAGDYYFDIREVLYEPLPRPPAPTVVAAPSQFTISIPVAFIPSDLQEFDIQYARSLDNATFGDWLDVGTFPAVNSQDGLDSGTTNPVGTYTHQVPDTTPLDTIPALPYYIKDVLQLDVNGNPIYNKLPYYVYRYRMRAGGRQSTWSGPTYAGQIQGDPVS